MLRDGKMFRPDTHLCEKYDVDDNLEKNCATQRFFDKNTQENSLGNWINRAKHDKQTRTFKQPVGKADVSHKTDFSAVDAVQTTLVNNISCDVLRLTSTRVCGVIDHFDEIYRHINDSFPGQCNSVFAHYNPLVSVPQIGARCGFVALAMASQMFQPKGARILFEEAKRIGLTLIGEMFDAYKMADFATNQLRCEANVLYNLNNRKYDMLSHICDGWPVLIPYDQEGSNPGIYFGETAHWAVLCGLFFNAGMTVDRNRRLRVISTTNGVRIKERLLYSCWGSIRDSDIYLLAREGTRKELLAWRLDTLLISNCNLWKASKKHGLSKDYELPNLRDKAILLKK